MENVIEIKNLSVIIKDRFLVKNIYLTLHKGECVGVLGEDKSGKTSLIKAISGSLPIKPGQAFIFGEDIFYNKKVLTKVSTCLDPPIFFKYQTVMDNIEYISSLSENKSKQKIVDVLQKFGLEKEKDTRVMFLPYYQKKLMALALAFLTEPEILLLDEPFKNLPERYLKIVKDAIKTARKNGATVIITSKNIELLEDECDRFVFMEERVIKSILQKEDVEEITEENSYAFIKVKYPHYVGKLLIDNYELKVKILGRRVIFKADEDEVAKMVRFITKHNLAIYGAGYITRKAEKIFAELTPYFKEEK